MPRVIPPTVTVDDRFFWDGLAVDELRIRRCPDCGVLHHPPTPMCPQCHSVSPGFVVSTGRGTVASWIVSRHPTEPDADPRIVVLVELDEGVRLVSNLVDIEADRRPRTTWPCEVCFVDVDGVRLPQFRADRSRSDELPALARPR